MLAGCATGTVGAAPSSSPTAAPTSSTRDATQTPTPTPASTGASSGAVASEELPAITPVSVGITQSDLRVLGANGELIASVSMYESKEVAIATLTEVFGFAPTPGLRSYDLPVDAGLGVVDFEGFMLVDPNPEDYRGWQFAALATTAEVRGIAIVGAGGAQVGASWAEMDALYGPSSPGGTWRMYYYHLDGMPYHLSIWGPDDGNAVTGILSPSGA
ncbi:MAG: hypothetical protein JWR04_422 [Rhodoglobus sp.]|nr:hypothetical protein [Rhodoglobus sp.]